MFRTQTLFGEVRYPTEAKFTITMWQYGVREYSTISFVCVYDSSNNSVQIVSAKNRDAVILLVQSSEEIWQRDSNHTQQQESHLELLEKVTPGTPFTGIAAWHFVSHYLLGWRGFVDCYGEKSS